MEKPRILSSWVILLHGVFIGMNPSFHGFQSIFSISSSSLGFTLKGFSLLIVDGWLEQYLNMNQPQEQGSCVSVTIYSSAVK